jgi:uncharacterized protein (TIGR04222 family)
MNPFELHGPAYLGFYLAALVTGAIAAYVVRGMILNKDDDRSVPGSAIARELDPYEAAYLVGGKDRAFIAACATLARHNIVTIDRQARSLSLLPGSTPGRLHDLESAIVSRVKFQNGALSLETLKTAVTGSLDAVHKNLVRRGLATSSGTHFAATIIPWTCYLIVALGFSLPKIAMAVEGKYPHGYLVIMTFWACVFSLCFLFGGSKTHKGSEVAEGLRKENAALSLTASVNPNLLSQRDTAMAYGIFGAMALAGDPFADIQHGLRLQRANGSGCGSGGSCGSSCGGGCGGGCGGCGG